MIVDRAPDDISATVNDKTRYVRTLRRVRLSKHSLSIEGRVGILSWRSLLRWARLIMLPLRWHVPLKRRRAHALARPFARECC